jgi:hypothetical protein
MVVELVAFSAPVPFLTQSMNLDTTGWHPLFRFGLSFDGSFGKKKYGKENQF